MERKLSRYCGLVKENRQTNGSVPVKIGEDTDPIATGLLDSLHVVDLFMFLENLLGCKIDLTDVDLSEVSAPRGLSRVALRDAIATSR